MKYLKTFESVDFLELKDFCESYLSYLIDDGYLIEVVTTNQSSSWRNCYAIWLTKNVTYIHVNDDDLFDWKDVKDHYIPFIKMLNNNYKIPDILPEPIIDSNNQKWIDSLMKEYEKEKNCPIIFERGASTNRITLQRFLSGKVTGFEKIEAIAVLVEK